MTPETRLDALAARVLAALPPMTAPASGGIGTIGFVRRFIETGGGQFGAEELRAIDALTRKVDVTGTVRRAYKPDWKVPVDQTPITEPEMAAVVLFFLVAAATDGDDTLDGMGRRLKWLNAAYNAADKLAADDAEAAQLKTVLIEAADRQLATIVNR